MVTETELLEIGFEQKISDKDDAVNEYYVFGGVEIWNYNDKYWIVEMLDQYCINRQFRTLEELNVFFCAIGKPLNIT